MGGRDAKTNGVGHPNEYPETGKSSGQIGKNDATTTNYGLYFRSYTAGSLFPGNSMDIVDTTKEPFYNRGGMTMHNYDGDSRSRDRSSYTVRSPGQEHPERYFSAFHASQSDIYGEKLNYFGGTGGNDACLQPSHSNIAHWGTDETKSWNANMRMEVCQKPIEGMASHTCADQSNRKAARWRPRPCFRALPLTRRRIHRHLFQFQLQ